MEKYICDDSKIFNLKRLSGVLYWYTGEMNLDFEPIKGNDSENYIYMHEHSYSRTEKYSFMDEKAATAIIAHTYKKLIEFIGNEERLFDMTDEACLQRCFHDKILYRE